MIEGEIRFLPELIAKLDKLPQETGNLAKKIVFEKSVLLASHTKLEYLQGGTTDTRLKVRTGKMRAECKPAKLEITKDSINGGITFGAIYSGVHVGKKGQITTIKAKHGKYLTIPLPAAQTGAGVLRGTAKSGTFAQTFFATSKKGNLILFGKQTSAKGKHSGEAKGKIVPLFVLKKQVEVKSRVHPEDILKWIKPQIEKDFVEGAENL